MIEIPWSKFPLVHGHEHAHRRLQFYANIGRAPNTIIAYGRAVDDHLRSLAEAGTDPLGAGLDVVAAWIGDMLSRPNPRGAVLVQLEAERVWRTPPSSSGSSLAVQPGLGRMRVHSAESDDRHQSKPFTGHVGRASAQSGNA